MIKDICIKCCERNREVRSREKWIGQDDINWGNGLIACPVNLAGSSNHRSHKPFSETSAPSWCVYTLEHEVIGQ